MKMENKPGGPKERARKGLKELAAEMGRSVPEAARGALRQYYEAAGFTGDLLTEKLESMQLEELVEAYLQVEGE